MRRAIGCLLLLVTAAAPAAERPGGYAYGARLDADGKEALYDVTLPAAVYRGVVQADLRDVRVFNGGDEVVPHAWRPRRMHASESSAQAALTLFALKARAGVALDRLAIRVHRGAGGAVTVDVSDAVGGASSGKTVGYLVDLTAFEHGLRAIELDWVPIPSGFAGRLRVEGSDDLGSWRPIVAAAPLVELEIAGQRLQQKRVELPRQTVKYLRLSWVQGDGAEMPELTAARGELPPKTVEVEREWAPVEGGPGGKPGEYAFDTGGHFPVDRVRFSLPEPNTIVQVELLTRGKPDQSWRHVGSGVVYRLRKGEGEIMSPDLAMASVSDRYWLVRVDQRGGGLGAGAPKLEVGWVPHQLVFAARGTPPFQLAYGRRDAQPAAFAIEAIVPGYREDEASTIRAAKSAVAPSVNVQAAKALAPTELGGAERTHEVVDWKRWSLWGALILGVVILAGMAWRLVKQLDKPATPAASDDTQGKDRSG